MAQINLRRPSSRKSDFHTIYPSEDDEDGDDDCGDEIKSGWKLYEKIFSYLDPPSLLTARQVCTRWNLVICKYVDSHVWSKMCVKIVTSQNWPSPKPFPSPSSSPSVDIFYSPNFHFVQCDFRLEFVQDFFVCRGPFLKCLKMSDCVLSLPMLQVIIYSCERLEHFEVNGLSQNVVVAEMIFPRRIPCRKFPFLKTLILKSSLEGPPLKNEPTEGIDIENTLTRGFVHDLIEHSDNLTRIHLIGWKAKSGCDLMSILTHRGRYKKLSEFHMTGTPAVIKSVHLIPLCVRTSHIRLRKLTINPQTVHQSNDFGNIVIREVLKNHRESLEELNISNCPVGSSIFRFPMPRLRILVTIGTMIKSTMLFRHQTPNLETFIYREDINSPKQVFKRIQLLIDSSPQRSFKFNPQYFLEKIRTKLGHLSWDSGQTFAEMMAVKWETRDIHGNEEDGTIEENLSSSSILSGFDTCSWIDFTSLVFLATLLILLFMWGLSTIFHYYSPILFLLSISTLIFFEVYSNFDLSALSD